MGPRRESCSDVSMAFDLPVRSVQAVNLDTRLASWIPVPRSRVWRQDLQGLALALAQSAGSKPSEGGKLIGRLAGDPLLAPVGIANHGEMEKLRQRGIGAAERAQDWQSDSR